MAEQRSCSERWPAHGPLLVTGADLVLPRAIAAAVPAASALAAARVDRD